MSNRISEKSKLVIRSVDGSPALTTVTFEHNGQSITVDNCLAVDVQRDGRVVLTFDNAEYHGPGAGINCSVDTKPRPLTRCPAPTLDEFINS